MPRKSELGAARALARPDFFAHLERELETVEFFPSPDKRETMQITLRNLLRRHARRSNGRSRLKRGHHGARRVTQSGPVVRRLDGLVGACCGSIGSTEHTITCAMPGDSDRRRCAACSRRLPTHPTDCRATYGTADQGSQSFAGMFKRQTPEMPTSMISCRSDGGCADFTDVLPANESAESRDRTRSERHAWLDATRLLVVTIRQADVVAERTWRC